MDSAAEDIIFEEMAFWWYELALPLFWMHTYLKYKNNENLLIVLLPILNFDGRLQETFEKNSTHLCLLSFYCIYVHPGVK